VHIDHRVPVVPAPLSISNEKMRAEPPLSLEMAPLVVHLLVMGLETRTAEEMSPAPISAKKLQLAVFF
jgi:hypothetical protein